MYQHFFKHICAVMNNRLPKAEKLTHFGLIEALFSKGKSFGAGPFRIFYVEHNEEDVKAPVQVVFSVPKKKFKRAVDRNRIKRLMRESYRLNKHELLELAQSRSKKWSIGLIYRSSEMPEFKEVNGKIILSLQRLIQEINQGE